jgi:5-methylcytosine-specific restriction endonuclease McrA
MDEAIEIDEELFILKQCVQCGQLGIRLDFHKHPGYKDGRHPHCKRCRKGNRRERYWNNREENLARNRRWNHDHPEKINEYRERYKRRHPDRVEMSAASRQQRITETHTGPISYDEVLRISESICYLCNQAIGHEDISFDHIIPLSRGGTDTEDNIKPAHLACNLYKGTRTVDELKARIDYVKVPIDIGRTR